MRWHFLPRQHRQMDQTSTSGGPAREGVVEVQKERERVVAHPSSPSSPFLSVFLWIPTILCPSIFVFQETGQAKMQDLQSATSTFTSETSHCSQLEGRRIFVWCSKRGKKGWRDKNLSAMAKICFNLSGGETLHIRHFIILHFSVFKAVPVYSDDWIWKVTIHTFLHESCYISICQGSSQFPNLSVWLI